MFCSFWIHATGFDEGRIYEQSTDSEEIGEVGWLHITTLFHWARTVLCWGLSAVWAAVWSNAGLPHSPLWEPLSPGAMLSMHHYPHTDLQVWQDLHNCPVWHSQDSSSSQVLPALQVCGFESECGWIFLVVESCVWNKCILSCQHLFADSGD